MKLLYIENLYLQIIYKKNLNSKEAYSIKLKISEFSSWILNVGDGTIEGINDLENEDATWIKIPEKYLLHYDSDPIKKNSNTIYIFFLILIISNI